MIQAPLWVQVVITRLVFDLMKFLAITLGGSILFGGPDRMKAPAFATLIGWAPYWVWGGSLMGLGLLSLIRSVVIRRWVYTLVSVWFLTVWASLVASLMWEDQIMAGLPAGSPRAPLTGVAVYLTLTALYIACAVCMWMDKRPIHQRRVDWES